MHTYKFAIVTQNALILSFNPSQHFQTTTCPTHPPHPFASIAPPTHPVGANPEVYSHEATAFYGLVHVHGCHGDDILAPSHVPVKWSVVVGHWECSGGSFQCYHRVGGWGEPVEGGMEGGQGGEGTEGGIREGERRE